MRPLLRNARCAVRHDRRSVHRFDGGVLDERQRSAVSCFLVAVSLAAIYLPARRAARSDPMVPLRND